MKTFMLIGVRDSKARCVCTVRAETLNHAAHVLRGGAYPGVIRGVSVSDLIGTQAIYAVFRPSKGTSTVLESSIAKLGDEPGNNAVFGDFLKRSYDDWLLAEVASIN